MAIFELFEDMAVVDDENVELHIFIVEQSVEVIDSIEVMKRNKQQTRVEHRIGAKAVDVSGTDELVSASESAL